MGIQNRQKCLGCITQSAAEHTDALDRAIAFAFKAANDSELVLAVAHHLSDIDVSRFSHQTDAAVATAHCVEITLLTEIVDDLHQVRLRDIESLRDVFDRRQLTVVEPDLNEDAQREIGMKGLNALFSPPGARQRAALRPR
jgi:hypothetical protein